MDSEDSSSQGDAAGPGIFGLEAFDLDFQYAMWGPSFGLDPPRPYAMGPLDLVSQKEWSQLMANMVIQMWIGQALVFAIHSIWHTIVYRLLNWVITSHFSLTLFNWQFQFKALPTHICLLLCVNPTGWKDLTLATLQHLTRRGDSKRDTDIFFMQGIALLSYCMASLICHNIRQILRLLFRPPVLLLIGLLSLYALGFIQSIFHQSKLFISATLERIWVASTKLLSWLLAAHQNYTKAQYQIGVANLYEYAELGPSQIRLVELYRSHPLATPSIRLLSYSLPNTPPYEAISYTWVGDVTTNDSILINGCSLPVTRNAVEVLHKMAPFWGSRMVWIDSICINQQNPLDKNRQVALLAKIFRRATRTIAWLGDSPNAEYAVLQLRRLRQLVIDTQTLKTLEEAEVVRMLKQNGLGLDTFQRWGAVSELLSHNYWTRVWIVQEVAVSSSVHIAYGIHDIHMDSISEVVRGLNRISDEYNIGDVFERRRGFERSSHPISPSEKIDQRVLNLLNIKIITNFRQLIQKSRYPELREAVEATYIFNATDPRDKIYAFCNIATYSGDADLDPDYTISVKDVYTRFTKHYITTHFQNLVFASGQFQPRQQHDLPSWVPDFTSSGSMHELPIPGPHLKDGYTASGEHRQLAIALDSSYEIRLRGVYVDEITQFTSHALEPSSDKSLFSPAVHGWHEEAVSLVVANIPPTYRCYEESRRQAFIRTLIGDRNSGGAMAEVIYKKYYKYWCDFLNMSTDSGSRALDLSTSKQSQKMQGAGIFSSANLRVGQFRRFAITREGYMALVPKEVEVGDIVCVVLGLDVPLVLRLIRMDKVMKAPIYKLVGWCYCHGIMMGEAVESGEFETFIIQ